MSSPSYVRGDHVYEDDHRFVGTMSLPNGVVDADAVAADAEIADTQQQHRHKLDYSTTGTPAAFTVTRYVCRKAGGATLANFKVGQRTKNSSGTVTVDVKKSAGGGAPATILTGTVTMNSSNTDRVAVDLTLADAAMANGDRIELVVTVSSPNGDGFWFEGEAVEASV